MTKEVSEKDTDKFEAIANKAGVGCYALDVENGAIKAVYAKAIKLEGKSAGITSVVTLEGPEFSWPVAYQADLLIGWFKDAIEKEIEKWREKRKP